MMLKNKKTRKGLSLYFTVLLAMGTQALSAAPVATTLFALNKVEAGLGSALHPLTRGASVNLGEAVVTGADSRSQIKYTSGALVAIQPNSRYQTLNYGPDSFKASVSIGAIEYNSSGKKQGVIETPVVALAILGTHFRLIVTLDKTYVDVIEGLVVGGGQRFAGANSSSGPGGSKAGRTMLGPKEKYHSGSFDRSGSFTPGEIPWDAAIGTAALSNTAGSGLDQSNNGTVMTISEVNAVVVTDAVVDAVAPALVSSTGLAVLTITLP